MILPLTKDRIKLIESQLIYWYRPIFIDVSIPNDSQVLIFISCRIFNNKEIIQRIQMVNDTISSVDNSILNDYLVIVQPFTPTELDDIREHIKA